MGLGELFSRLGVRRRTRALEDLKDRLACFREILQANNAALGGIARIQEVLEDDGPLGPHEVRRLVAGVTVQTYRMVLNLNRLTGERHRELLPRFDGIRRKVTGRAEVTPALREVGLVVPLAEVDAGLAEVVGQKSAYLGEARRILGGRVPDGFATTAAAYRAFMAAGDLGARLAELMATVDPGDIARYFELCARAQAWIEAAPVPREVADALREAVARLPAGRAARLAVRSSALQEGGVELSFAGQYRSLLNVPPDGICDAFKGVIASKYSPQAVTYRFGRGFDDAEIAMCCCVITMVDAAAAGVLYSACRTGDGVVTLLQAVRGLGLSAVDGSAEPDTFTIEPRTGAIVRRKRGTQSALLRPAPGEGTERVALDPARAAPALADRHAVDIARLAWAIEQSLGAPIDMEWAITAAGEPWVLQVRPQPEHAEEAAGPTGERVPGAPIALEGGSRASGGVGCGRAFVVDSDLDLLRFPTGGVLVTREANPRFAVLLPRAAALVCDMGETTGHLATVARELRVPALLATRRAALALAGAAEVTVDADAGVIYHGRIESRIEAASASRPAAAAGPRNPNRENLARAAETIVPLTLPVRLASGFSPKKCRTLHDLIRFCHQGAVEEMFSLGDRAVQRGATLRRLVSEVPIDCRLLDLGGGIHPDAPALGDLGIEHVACVPMRALWRGMTDPRLGQGPPQRPLSMRGFMSSVANFGFDEDARMRGLGEPSYAFVTAEYLNLNSRIGYHFSTVDARVGEHDDANYASFRFVGGSTGVDQRSRRAVLIERLLASRGFETDRRVDLVNARLRHLPAAELEAKLVLVGLLLEFVNHLDMALTSDEAMAAYVQAFETEDYGFRRKADG